MQSHVERPAKLRVNKIFLSFLICQIGYTMKIYTNKSFKSETIETKTTKNINSYFKCLFSLCSHS